MKTNVRRVSMLSGIEHNKEFNFSEEELNNFKRMVPSQSFGGIKWSVPGLLIQEAFPKLPPEDREYLMTGITNEEWSTLGSEE